MKVSVFTPLTANGNQFIAEAYASLCAQDYIDWEWIVLENHGGNLPRAARKDPRVKVYGSTLQGVGRLKRQACGLCSGDILLELDHDDLLHPSALGRVVAEVCGGADFVYSDFAEFKSPSWQPNAYVGHGWQSYGVQHEGPHGSVELTAMRAPEDPIAWRRIEWAPNHLRAWRRSFYETLPGLSYPETLGGACVPFVGGHDESLFFADDHDLVLRTLLHGGKCSRIAACLYWYRVHGTNNVTKQNDRIQESAARVYDRHITRLAEFEAKRRGLALVDLCGGHGCPSGYEAWDKSGACDVTSADLDERWPAGDSTVGVLRAFDAIEHLRDKVHTMNEAHRVLAPGGVFMIWVPSTDALLEKQASGEYLLFNGSGAYCDPTHVSFWNYMSFRYYTDDRFRKYVPGITARFQIARLRNVNSGGIPYVQAELIALKPGYEPMGKVDC